MFPIQIYESNELIKRFCKDYNLPINLYEYPYFFRRLLLAKTYMPNIFDKFHQFVESVSKFATEQEYFEYYNKLKDRIITDIGENPDYILFNNDASICAPKWNFEKHNLYQPDNDTKSFISVDMRKANFTAMKLYSPAIFNGTQTWEEFMSQYTDIQSIIESKYIRQVILGALNPKRQVSYEAQLLKLFYDALITALPELSNDIYSVCADELIFKFNPARDYSKLSSLMEHYNDTYRIEFFTLYKLSDSIDGYKKVFLNDSYQETSSYTLKGVDADFMPQILCQLADEKISANDLTFCYNGKLARFVIPINEVSINPLILYERYNNQGGPK